MKKLILALVSFFAMPGVVAQTGYQRSVVVDCEDKDWQTLSPLKWQQLKRSEQNGQDIMRAVNTFLSKLSAFEKELDAWHKNILNVNSYPNPNTIEDEKEKNELLQKIKNDPDAIINRAKQGFKLLDDFSSMRIGNTYLREEVRPQMMGIAGKTQPQMRYLERNLAEKVQAFNKYNSAQTTSSQKDTAHKVLVRDFDYKEAISKIRALLQK